MKKPASILDTLSDSEMSAVVKRIVFLREKAIGLTQEQFAQELHVTQSYVSQLEAGRKPLSKSAYEKILATFNVDPDWLLYGESDNIYRKNENEQHVASDFIAWYKSLSVEKQASFAKAVKEISKLYID